MKTYNEYLQEINKLRKQKKEKIEYPDLPIEDRKEWRKPENEEKRNKYNKEIERISKENNEINKENNKIDIKIAILRCNAKHAIFNEIFPKVYEILKKYNGKPIGEKREKTIRDELKEKYSITYYIKQWYSNDEITIFELTKEGWRKIGGYEIQVRTKSNTKLFKENKLDLPPIEEFILMNTNSKFTENVDQLTEQIITKHNELKKLHDKFKMLQEEYNGLLIENISYIYDINDIRDYPTVKYNND